MSDEKQVVETNPEELSKDSLVKIVKQLREELSQVRKEKTIESETLKAHLKTKEEMFGVKLLQVVQERSEKETNIATMVVHLYEKVKTLEAEQAKLIKEKDTAIKELNGHINRHTSRITKLENEIEKLKK